MANEMEAFAALARANTSLLRLSATILEMLAQKGICPNSAIRGALIQAKKVLHEDDRMQLTFAALLDEYPE